MIEFFVCSADASATSVSRMRLLAADKFSSVHLQVIDRRSQAVLQSAEVGAETVDHHLRRVEVRQRALRAFFRGVVQVGETQIIQCRDVLRRVKR